jgi:glycosyltransferase involved in cell wall biosynthesis
MLINTGQLFSHILKEQYDIIHSFSRLAYLTPVLPMRIPKVMSYQREPTLSQIKKAAQLSSKGSLVFTGCSDYISNQIKPYANSVTVYNCVPVERYDFSPSIKEDAPLSFLGRIEPIKGTHIAVQVAQRTNRRLVIAGNIPAEGEVYFKEKIKPHLNERIQYIGPVNDQQKNDFLGQSAAFLMPIQWNEPFGIVMAEAMACGTPVVGFPFGSVPEVVDHGITGYLCKDTDDMVNSVSTIYSIDRKKVREEAIKRFSDTVIVSAYIDLYKTMLSQNKQSRVKHHL